VYEILSEGGCNGISKYAHVETRWFGVEHSVGWSWAAELGVKIRLKREKTKGKNRYGDETE
jgi:hypothetical protein